MQSIYHVESLRRVFSTFEKKIDFKIRREHQKISYERRAYESVVVTRLFLVISHKSKESSTEKTQRDIKTFRTENSNCFPFPLTCNKIAGI